MRIVTLNCWGGRVPGLIKWLKEVNADVYCLQEVYHSPNADVESASDHVTDRDRGGKTLKIRTNLFTEIGDALTNEYHRYFWPTTRWQLEGKDADIEVYYGIATYIRSTIPAPVMQTRFVHEEFRALPRTELPTPRIAHAVELYRGDKPLIVAHMHGLWDPAGKKDSPARDEQFGKFEALISSMGNFSYPAAIVCGDFNILPDSKYLRSFKRSGFDELVVGGNFKSTRTSYYKRDPDKMLPHFADYMLVKRVKVKNFDVVYDPEVSDHCPLVLDIE